ncbi:MAG: helix-turn-helix domain-containing protein [Alphaproteobacteria bacterium]|nr:helix-turn-helix domain-containing protein [Alphaproteobacteria bacterium]
MTSEDDALSYNIDQAAALTGMGRSALYLALRDGRLTGRKAGRRLVILRRDLERFLSDLPPALELRRPLAKSAA